MEIVVDVSVFVERDVEVLVSEFVVDVPVAVVEVTVMLAFKATKGL